MTPALSLKRIGEKADILENNLFKQITKQASPSKMQIAIERANFPNSVILKALLQLMPRYNIKPRSFIVPLKDLLNKRIPPDKPLRLKIELDLEEDEDTSDAHTVTRVFEAAVSTKVLVIRVYGIPEIRGSDGDIGKSFFNHELSAGKLLKGGLIDFKEINKFPVVNSGDALFYIEHEQQGKPGFSFDGKVIEVHETTPYPIRIGDGVEKTDDVDDSGRSKGYYLKSEKTGVVLMERNENGRIISIEIKDQIDVEKLDYSVGNVGTRYTCPISMNVGEICAGFKIRVNGNIEANIVDGGEIITNNDAEILKSQSGSSILALKDISVHTATRSKLISERGTITIHRELIDSELSAPKIILEKNRGLVTNNRIETEHLFLKGCFFSAENTIYFGNSLFVEEKEQLKFMENARSKRLDYENKEKLLMGQLQLELKRLTKLASMNPDLLLPIKSLIINTKTMDYKDIYLQIKSIEKLNTTRVVANVKKIFKSLEKIPASIKACVATQNQIKEELDALRQRMDGMSLVIEGYLRHAGTLKIFCGLHDPEKKIEPDLIVDSGGSGNKAVSIKGSYSRRKGFELVQ